MDYYLNKHIIQMKSLITFINEEQQNAEIDFVSYRLVCYTKWGSVCLNDDSFTTLNKAIEEGRKMKRDKYAFSYQVYGIYEKDGKRKRRLLKNG